MIRDANLDDPRDTDALFSILDAYARGPGGQNAPLSDEARTALVPGLHAHPQTFELLASVDGAVVGAAERRARARGCCKLTLEVHESNTGAQRLYREFGFGGWESRTLFATKRLREESR